MKKLLIYIFVIAIAIAAFSGCGKVEKEENVPVSLPVEEKRVSFLGVGDNLIHNSVYWQADSNAAGSDYDFKPMYSLVADRIAAADIAYINQETILGGTELGLSSYPRFNSPQELGRDMIELGFDVFSHATNHAFDKGEAGVANAYSFYEANPSVTCIGLHKKGEDLVKIVEKGGMSIAFVNYTYTTNGLSLPEDSAYYVPLADFDSGCADMTDAVKRAAAAADFVVCCLHWGDENQTEPNSIQRQTAAILADAGCDVIIGTHPHAIQPVEYIGDTLVVYSLGNFISAQISPVNLLGGMINFDFVLTGEDKSIENVQFHPVITQYGPGFDNIRIVPLSQYTPDLAAAHGSSVSADYFSNLAESTIAADILAK